MVRNWDACGWLLLLTARTDIADILPNHVNISPTYYTFKFNDNRFYHLLDRAGTSRDEGKLLALLHGKDPYAK